MALLEAALYTKLSGTSAITDIVGSSTGCRIYPNVLPQDATLPAIVYNRISGPREQIMGGMSGLQSPRIQINCYAATYAAAKALADKIRISIDGTTRTTWGGETIEACILLDDGDLYESSEDQTERRLHGVRQDFEIWHQEATS